MKLIAGALFALAAARKNPVSRVVGLLEDLRTTSEKDGKTEEKSFLKFKCWYTSTKKEYEEYNAQAKEQLISLKQTLKDIEQGYTELTPERKENEKALNQVLAEIQTMQNNEKERKKNAEDEIDNLATGISAMDTALAALKTGSASSAMLLVKGVSIKKVVAMGEAVLDAQDAQALRKNMNLQPDYKKLNDKSSLESYSPGASEKIIELVEKMMRQFKKKHKNAVKDHEEAMKEHDELMASKAEEKDGYESALLDAKGEKGAKARRTKELQEQIENIETTVADNKKWIEESTKKFDEAKTIYDERVVNRATEMAAIGQAIGILHSDDSRDLFKNSFESQGQFFLQVGSFNSNFKKFMKAVKDARSRKVAIRELSKMGNSAIQGVIDSIDEILKQLDQNDARDFEEVENCKKDLEEQYVNARDESIGMDKASDRIAAEEQEIEDAETEKKEVSELEKQRKIDLEERTKLNKERREAFEVSRKDDEAAIQLVEQASVVLDKVFGGKFLQSRVRATFRHTAHKEAPPAPELSYEGTDTGSSSGGSSIVGMLKMIQQDIEKDLKEATEEMDEEDADYVDFQTASAEQEAKNEDRRVAAEDSITESQQSIKAANTNKSAAKELLDTAMKTVDTLRSNEGDACDYMGLNYAVKKKNRQLEREGLNDAITILKSNLEGAAQ